MNWQGVHVVVQRRGLLRLVLAGVLWFPLQPAAATVLRVPSQYYTITHALHSAAEGDTVLVAPGEYYENVVWSSAQSLKLRSEGGAEVTSIDGMGVESVIRILTAIDSTTIVRGFTIKNGSADRGGGIRCEGAAPTLVDNIIVSNVATFYGGGIYCGGDWTCPLLVRNTISDNTVLDGSGGGIGCCEGAAVTILQCTVTGNSAPEYYGGGIHCEEGVGPARAIVIADCLLEGNTAGGGGGLSLFSPFVYTPKICGTIVRNNTAAYGGGIYAYWTEVTLFESEIRANHATSHGGGMFMEDCSLSHISESEIAENTAAAAGGGVAMVLWSTEPTLEGNRILHNSAPEGGGIYCYLMSSPILRDNLIAFNQAPARGGALFCDDHCEPQLYDNVVLENRAPIAGGLYFAESEPIITGCTVTRNDDAGIYFDVPWERRSVTISDNSIAGNVGYGLFNSHASVEIDARSNWWGDASGPYHPTLNPTGEGDPVSDDVEFDPWLTDPGGLCAAPSTVDEELRLICYPNPFRATTTIRFQLPGPAKHGDIRIYDVTGRCVSAFPIDRERSGEIRWSGIDNAGCPVMGGVHYVRLQAGPWQEVQRLICLR